MWIERKLIEYGLIENRLFIREILRARNPPDVWLRYGKSLRSWSQECYVSINDNICVSSVLHRIVFLTYTYTFVYPPAAMCTIVGAILLLTAELKIYPPHFLGYYRWYYILVDKRGGYFLSSILAHICYEFRNNTYLLSIYLAHLFISAYITYKMYVYMHIKYRIHIENKKFTFISVIKALKCVVYTMISRYKLNRNIWINNVCRIYDIVLHLFRVRRFCDYRIIIILRVIITHSARVTLWTFYLLETWYDSVVSTENSPASRSYGCNEFDTCRVVPFHFD